MTTTSARLQRRRVAARGRAGPDARLHAGAADRRASADRRRPPSEFVEQRSAAGARAPRAEGLGAGARAAAGAAASSGCSASTCPRRTAASRSTRSRSMVVSERMSRVGVVRRHVRRAGQPRHPAAAAVRHRGAEAAVPAAAADRRAGRRLLPERDRARAPTRSARKTRATRQPDGSFVLNGEKMWITNGGFADVFIVFAKVDGEHFTAFIVERAFAGVTSGKEEHKMGLHGSSTTPVMLQDVKVPADEPARRNRQGPQGRVQRAELRPVQARRDVRRRRRGAIGEAAALRRRSEAVRPADRVVRRDQAQARRDGRRARTRSRACSIAPPG